MYRGPAAFPPAIRLAARPRPVPAARAADAEVYGGAGGGRASLSDLCGGIFAADIVNVQGGIVGAAVS
jgi:hypothetical protein